MASIDFKIKYFCGCVKVIPYIEYRRVKNSMSIYKSPYEKCMIHKAPWNFFIKKCAVCGDEYQLDREHYKLCHKCTNKRTKYDIKRRKKERAREAEEIKIIDDIFEEL